MTDHSNRVPAKRRNLSHQVAEAIGKTIADGVYRPGDCIDPEEIMTKFDISRSVFRECVRLLDSKGMITAKPHIGTRVTPCDRWNLFDPDVSQWLSPTNTGAEFQTHAKEFYELLLSRPGMLANPYFQAALLAVTNVQTENP